MTPIAITMMLLAMTVVWGGMVLSAIHLMRNPDETSGTLSDRTDGAGRGTDGADARP